MIDHDRCVSLIQEVNVQQLQDAAVLIPADQLFNREDLIRQT